MIFNLIGWGEHGIFIYFYLRTLDNLSQDTFTLGVPLLIVSISWGATQGDGYGTGSFCWLNVDDNLISVFFAPAILVIYVSFCVVHCCFKSINTNISIMIMFSGEHCYLYHGYVGNNALDHSPTTKHTAESEDFRWSCHYYVSRSWSDMGLCFHDDQS